MWSERLRRAAALLCGLLLVNLPHPVWASVRKASAVHAEKRLKKTAAGREGLYRPGPRKIHRKKSGSHSSRISGSAAPTLGMADLREADQVGLHGSASFYGRGFQGRRSADGQRYDVRAFTAASNHFPLGARVAVRRLDSERCAIVTITDRMHARHRRRIIDVSRAVAEYLDMIRAGVVMVRVASVSGRSHAGANCRAAFEADDLCPDCASQPPWPAPEGDLPLFRLNRD